MPPPPARRSRSARSRSVGRVAGEREEDLVQARLPEREVGDARCRRRSAPRSPRRPVSASEHCALSAAASASRWTLSSRAPRIRSASGRCAGSSSRTLSEPTPTEALSCAGVPSAITLPRSITAMPVGELVGLLQVLGAEQDRRAAVDERADDVPDLVARARVEAGRRLVQEHQLRRRHDRGGDVEPAAHAAGEVLDQPARRLARGRTPRAARRRGPWPAARPKPSSRPIRIRFSRPVRSSSTEASWPVRVTRLRTVSASLTMSWPSTRAEPAVGAISVASIRIVVVLPAPLGPSTP